MPSSVFKPHHAYVKSSYVLKTSDAPNTRTSVPKTSSTYPHREASEAKAGAPSQLKPYSKARPGRGIDKHSGLSTAEAKEKERVAKALASYDEEFGRNFREMQMHLNMPDRKK
jgi:hypothetical protein